MTKHFLQIILAACIATFSLIELPTAQAKEQCSAAMPSHPHGYWSWRLIDGRKCWYEGNPGLSKSLLEWPIQASAEVKSAREVAGNLTEKSGNPLDSHAQVQVQQVQTAPETFEALWQARVEH